MIINYLAIIPARSGSKGIINKNILKINGKECFRYTLEPVIKSKVDKIFVYISFGFSNYFVNFFNIISDF